MGHNLATTQAINILSLTLDVLVKYSEGWKIVAHALIYLTHGEQSLTLVRKGEMFTISERGGEARCPNLDQ